MFNQLILYTRFLSVFTEQFFSHKTKNKSTLKLKRLFFFSEDIEYVECFLNKFICKITVDIKYGYISKSLIISLDTPNPIFQSN